jgi:hypothetical protein
MQKIVGWVLGLIVLVVVILIGGVNLSNSAVVEDTAEITNYHAAFDVRANGDLKVVELLTVSFPDYKHGIFRFFDTRFPGHPKDRVLPTDIKVSMDNQSEPFSLHTASRGRYEVAQIGSAGVTITGSHVYEISYAIKGVLIKGTSTRTQFYWNLIPGGWRNTIDKSTLTVHLPAAALAVKCAVGSGSGDGTCTASGQGSTDLTVVTGRLAPNTPVTISAGMDIATPAANTLPWSSSLDPILGRHPGLLVIILILAALLAVGGALLSRSTKEEDPGFPLLYAPPEGIGPAQAAYIVTETLNNKAFIGTLMYAAEQGAIDLRLDEQGWTVTGAADTTTWTKIDGVTQQTLLSLGINAPGASFTASPTSVSAGQQLKGALSEFDSNTRGWARIGGLMVSSGLGAGGIVVVGLTWLLTIYLGAFNPLHMSVIAVVPGLFGITALGVAATGAGTKRTASGRDLWSRAGGFRRILSTESAEDRFDFAGRKDLYISFLPWAVAFDCADTWARKYKLATNEEPPTPNYFLGYSALYAGSAIGSMVDSFDSSMSSAVSAYDATQSSSGGGGGGFGGGGGGGGGGSW